MKANIKFTIIVALIFGLIGCGGGGGSANESYAGGPSGTGVGTRVEIQGEFTNANGEAVVGGTVEDRVSGQKATTNEVGFYSLFATPNANFEVQLRIRNEATANEETISLPVSANTQGAQVDIVDRGPEGFDYNFEVFSAEDNFDFGGGFTAPNSGGGSNSNGGSSSTEEFLAEGSNDFSNGEQRTPTESDTEKDIKAESFEAEFDRERGRR